MFYLEKATEDEYFLCVSQRSLFGDKVETMKKKKECSDILLDKAIHIYEDMRDAIKRINRNERFRIILSVLKKFNKSLQRFYTFGVGKNRVELLDICTVTEDKTEFLNAGYDIIEDSIKILHLIRDNVYEYCLDSPEKQDYIKKIMDKINKHLGNFLVKHLYNSINDM